MIKLALQKITKFTSKIGNSPVFAAVSPSIRKTDIKINEVQQNMSTLSAFLMSLLPKLSSILQTKKGVKSVQTEVIRIILNGANVAGQIALNLKLVRKSSQ